MPNPSTLQPPTAQTCPDPPSVMSCPSPSLLDHVPFRFLSKNRNKSGPSWTSYMDGFRPAVPGMETLLNEGAGLWGACHRPETFTRPLSLSALISHMLFLRGSKLGTDIKLCSANMTIRMFHYKKQRWELFSNSHSRHFTPLPQLLT